MNLFPSKKTEKNPETFTKNLLKNLQNKNFVNFSGFFCPEKYRKIYRIFLLHSFQEISPFFWTKKTEKFTEFFIL